MKIQSINIVTDKKETDFVKIQNKQAIPMSSRGQSSNQLFLNNYGKAFVYMSNLNKNIGFKGLDDEEYKPKYLGTKIGLFLADSFGKMFDDVENCNPFKALWHELPIELALLTSPILAPIIIHDFLKEDKEDKLSLLGDINKDVDKFAKNLGVSKEKASKIFANYLLVGAIGSDYDRGLNSVTSHSQDKLTLMKDVVVPVVAVQNKKKLGTRLVGQIPNGIILYGNDNAPKSYIANALGEHLEYFGSGYTKVEVDINDHEKNIENIKTAFENAEKKYRQTGLYSVVLIEGADRIFVDRNLNHKYKGEVAEIMKQADNCAQKGVIWVGTANSLKNMDPAVIRAGRTDIIFPIRQMKDFEIADTIQYQLVRNGLKSEAKTFDYNSVVDNAKSSDINLSYEKIQEIVKDYKEELKKKQAISDLNKPELTRSQYVEESYTNSDGKPESELDREDFENWFWSNY